MLTCFRACGNPFHCKGKRNDSRAGQFVVLGLVVAAGYLKGAICAASQGLADKKIAVQYSKWDA